MFRFPHAGATNPPHCLGQVSLSQFCTLRRSSTIATPRAQRRSCRHRPVTGGNDQRQKKRENQICCNCAGFARCALTQPLTPTLNEEKEKIYGAAHYPLHVKLRRYLDLETIRDEMINDYALVRLGISLG